MNQELIKEILSYFPTKTANSENINKVARKYYKSLPKSDDDFILFCDELISSGNWILFEIMTIWIKKRGTVYMLKYFPKYEEWLFNYINSWGLCDIYCYRVLNPMMEKFPILYEKAKEWSLSDKTYVKRAAAVCFIKIKQTFFVNVPFAIVKEICDNLLKDQHIHVQKGVGWLLKYTYLTYPKETLTYLKENIKVMSRTTYRYALEKMPEEMRMEMMKLK